MHRFGRPAVYWEEQESGFCAVHAINNLLQGAYFTPFDLSNIALKLDEQERRLLSEMGPDSADLIQFAADESHNVQLDGNFSIQVIRNALEAMNLATINIHSQEAKSALQDPLQETGFICNLQEHWLALRFVHGHWFDLNSLLGHPTMVTPTYLSIYLAQLSAEGYSIFVVRGSYPLFQQDLGGPGKWFDVNALVSASKNPQPAKRGRRTAEDAQLDAAIRASLLVSPTASASAPARAAPPPPEHRSPPTRAAPPSSFIIDDTSDADLRQALAMSLENDSSNDELYAVSLSADSKAVPSVQPAVPPVSLPSDSFAVRVHLPNGQKESRNFPANSTIGDVYRFSDTLTSTRDYSLHVSAPPRVFSDRAMSLQEAALLLGHNQLCFFLQPTVYSID